MELKISVKENIPINTNSSLFPFQNNVCTISCENVVVFTRVSQRSNSFKQTIPIHTVYAADLNSLFEPHVVMESLDQILSMKFDSTGQYLLIVTSSRHIQMYTKGPSLHQWTSSYTSKWGEEEIIYVDFFHLMKKPQIQVKDINISGTYVEKFQSAPHNPSLQSYANCPQKGFFCVTASGLFLAFTINISGVVEEEAKTVLGPVRDHYSLATAAFDQSGHIYIAAWKTDVVKCWEVKLAYEENEKMESEETPASAIAASQIRKLEAKVLSTTFFSPAPLNSSDEKAYKNVLVTHMVFFEPYDPKNLILFTAMDPSTSTARNSGAASQPQSANGAAKEEVASTRYVVQRYQMQVKTRPVFQLFGQSSPSENPNPTTSFKEWICQCEWDSSYPFISVGGFSSEAVAGFSPKSISVSTNDCTINVLNRETLTLITKYTLGPDPADDPTGKRPRERQIHSMATTWTNLHLVALDTFGSVHVFSLLKQSDIACTWLVYLVVLFEYALVSEYDWCDILMVVPPTSAQSIAERLSETFHLHHIKIVSNLISKFLVLKNSLLRLSSNLHHKSIEARLEAQLSTILRLFYSLRPVTADPTKPENIHSIVRNYIENRSSLEIPDIDKSIEQLLFNCNILDLQIDPAFCQDLQVLLEFSMDLALYLLFLLVQNSKFDMAKEPRMLQNLREILFLSRIWFKHNKLVQPQMIRKTDSIDIWAQIYKLLTRLAQIVPNEPDSAFLDDCILLETQIVCREFPLFIPPRGVLGKLAASSPSHFPLQFTYDQADPNPVVSNVNPRRLEGSLTAPQPLDPLNYRFLGLSGSNLQCTRCFAMRGSWCGTMESSTWEQEWSTRCICSGQWANSKKMASRAA